MSTVTERKTVRFSHFIRALHNKKTSVSATKIGRYSANKNSVTQQNIKALIISIDTALLKY